MRLFLNIITKHFYFIICGSNIPKKEPTDAQKISQLLLAMNDIQNMLPWMLHTVSRVNLWGNS